MTSKLWNRNRSTFYLKGVTSASQHFFEIKSLGVIQMEQIQERDERGSDGMKEAAGEVDHLAIADEPKKAFKKAGGFPLNRARSILCGTGRVTSTDR
jgi:hypothetical protein